MVRMLHGHFIMTLVFKVLLCRLITCRPSGEALRENCHVQTETGACRPSVEMVRHAAQRRSVSSQARLRGKFALCAAALRACQGNHAMPPPQPSAGATYDHWSSTEGHTTCSGHFACSSPGLSPSSAEIKEEKSLSRPEQRSKTPRPPGLQPESKNLL